MLGPRLVLSRKAKDEGEKPFWISYADLMTALMMLFLVVMSVSLLVVMGREGVRDREIDECMQGLKEKESKFGVKVHVEDRRIDFGERVRFGHNQYDLSKTDARLLREYAPEILYFADQSCGKKWFKRALVEGYTSKSGTYLYNMDLSLKRAESVLYALHGNPEPDEKPLTEEQKRRLQELFMVGGFSFNSAKSTDEESRRVEFKLEFLGVGEARQQLAGVEVANDQYAKSNSTPKK